MDDNRLAAFRERIETLLSKLQDDDTRGQSGQATVELDQQAIGRLSRMDALQNQAMAKATQARRQANASLHRLSAGSPGNPC